MVPPSCWIASTNRSRVSIAVTADAARGTTPRDAIKVFELRYADAAIRAAIDAAQDERDEMALYLAHARDLSSQLALLGGAAQWPLPIDEVEGELWFEVDRYVDARNAYERATRATNSPRAWIGLARAHVKLGETAAACDAYRHALQSSLSPEWKVEADHFVSSLACTAIPAPGSRLPAPGP